MQPPECVRAHARFVSVCVSVRENARTAFREPAVRAGLAAETLKSEKIKINK